MSQHDRREPPMDEQTVNILVIDDEIGIREGCK
jgi:hypothetical protein